MSEFDAKIEQLSKKQKQLQDDYAKTLARIESRKDRYDQANQELKNLGCGSVQEANKLIQKLREEINEKLNRLDEELT